mgnify:CR=1 FL=1
MARIKGPTWKVSRRLSFSVLETGEELQRSRSAWKKSQSEAFKLWTSAS